MCQIAHTGSTFRFGQGRIRKAISVYLLSLKYSKFENVCVVSICKKKNFELKVFLVLCTHAYMEIYFLRTTLYIVPEELAHIFPDKEHTYL